MKKIFFLMITIVSFSFGSELIKFNDTTNGSWNDFQALAAAGKKLIFIDAYTDWCVWCKVMDKETFSDSAVAEFMNSHFMNVRYEMETGFGITMSAKYRVNAFPTFLIFSAEGKLVYRIVGFHKPKEFLEILNTALNPSKQENLTGVSNNLNPDFPNFYLAAFGKSQTRVRPDSATVNSYLASSANLSAEAPYSVMFKFYSLLRPEFKQYLLDHFDTLKYLYGKNDMENIAGSIIRGKLSSAVKHADEAELSEVITLSQKYFPENSKTMELNYRLQYFTGTKQWKKFADEVEKGIAANLVEENGTNSFAWAVYEQCDEKPVIQRAAHWMQNVIEKFPRYMFVDTYAALLYKNGELKNAKRFAKKAIAFGKEEKTDVKETEELLQKINSELKPERKQNSIKKKK